MSYGKGNKQFDLDMVSVERLLGKKAKNNKVIATSSEAQGRETDPNATELEVYLESVDVDGNNTELQANTNTSKPAVVGEHDRESSGNLTAISDANETVTATNSTLIPSQSPSVFASGLNSSLLDISTVVGDSYNGTENSVDTKDNATTSSTMSTMSTDAPSQNFDFNSSGSFNETLFGNITFAEDYNKDDFNGNGNKTNGTSTNQTNPSLMVSSLYNASSSLLDFNTTFPINHMNETNETDPFLDLRTNVSLSSSSSSSSSGNVTDYEDFASSSPSPSEPLSSSSFPPSLLSSGLNMTNETFVEDTSFISNDEEADLRIYNGTTGMVSSVPSASSSMSTTSSSYPSMSSSFDGMETNETQSFAPSMVETQTSSTEAGNEATPSVAPSERLSHDAATGAPSLRPSMAKEAQPETSTSSPSILSSGIPTATVLSTEAPGETTPSPSIAPTVDDAVRESPSPTRRPFDEDEDMMSSMLDETGGDDDLFGNEGSHMKTPGVVLVVLVLGGAAYFYRRRGARRRERVQYQRIPHSWEKTS